MGLLAGIGIASVAIGWTGNRSKALDSPAVMNIGDGSGMMGREILAAAALLSNERGVRIEFSHQGRKGAIWVDGRSSNICVEIDYMTIRITPWDILMNDEAVSFSVFRERIDVYGSAARLTASKPVLLLSCSGGVDGPKLIEALQVLVDGGIDLIRLDHPVADGESSPTPPPSPQIKPLSHPVELK